MFVKNRSYCVEFIRYSRIANIATSYGAEPLRSAIARGNEPIRGWPYEAGNLTPCFIGRGQRARPDPDRGHARAPVSRCHLRFRGLQPCDPQHPSKADRRKAIVEGFRVLKPGGRIVIADIKTTALYEEALRDLGASNVERRRLGWRFWWGNPIAATTLLTASKGLKLS